MTDKAHDKELAALKADIARLREEIVSLAAGVRNTSGRGADGSQAEGGHDAAEGRGAGDGEQNHDVWMELLHMFDTSRAQGEKVFKGLAAEVEKHPLASIMAAFGLGYLAAKIRHEGDKK
jgi:hypothetical protein